MARVDPLLLQGHLVTGGLLAVCPQKVEVCPGEDTDSEKGKTEGALALNWFKINHGIILFPYQAYKSQQTFPPYGFASLLPQIPDLPHLRFPP